MINRSPSLLIFILAQLILVMPETLVPFTAKAASFTVSTPAQLSSALAAAQVNGEDDVIRIAQGSYAGNFMYSSHEAHDLVIQGGWTANFAGRVIQPANTVLDGGMAGTVLVVSSDQEINLTIEGLTIQNGSVVDHDGGGLYISNNRNEPIQPNTTMIRDCIIRNNVAKTGRVPSRGGGIFLWTSTRVVIARNTISGNSAIDLVSAGSEGGGLYVDTSKNLDISNNQFTGNQAYRGGGIWASANWWNAPDGEQNSIRANSIRDNQASGDYGDGGGLYCTLYNPASITGNTFSNNSAGRQGGGLFLHGRGDRSSTLVNNLLAGNTAGSSGGGMCLWIHENTTVSFGMTNNTVTGNQAGSHGGGLELILADDTATASLFNNIIWGNDSFNPGRDLYIDNDFDDNYLGSVCTLANNDFSRSGGGTFLKIPFAIPASNLNDLDPLFAQPAAGNYRLGTGSPCLDAGSNAASGLPATDIEGNARILGSAVDMGAYEGAFVRANFPVIAPIIMLLQR